MSDYSFGSTVIGAKELQNALNSADSFARDAIKHAINFTAADIEASAVHKAPTKRGGAGLRGSIHYDKAPGHVAEVSGDNITAIVGTNLSYARAQEYGLPARKIVPVRAKALRFKTKDGTIIFAKSAQNPG